LDLLVLAQ
jgi:hypothetical protein